MSSYLLQANTYAPLAGHPIRRDMEYSRAPVTNERPVEFNDLYDISEDEEDSADIPITIDVNSPIATRNTKQYPTLAIPDLSMWPSVHNKSAQQPQIFETDLLSPHLKVPRAELSRMQQRGTAQSTSSRTPSLDGSLTSDEMNSISCPSTPDVGAAHDDDEPSWTLPAQLDPSSLLTLAGLTKTNDNGPQLFETQPMEMTERGTSLASMLTLRTEYEMGMSPIESGELSALSIPSPGGFFASLNVGALNSWVPDCIDSPEEGVATSFALDFYAGRSFENKELPPLPTEEELYDDDTQTEGPPTARQVPPQWQNNPSGLEALKSPDYFAEFEEYNDNYARQLHEQSSANIDRTSSWLASQMYAGDVNGTPETIQEEEEPTELFTDSPRPSDADETFCRGFEFVNKIQSSSDTFIHRKTRTEKLRLDRKCLFDSHISQLEGKYSLTSPSLPTPTKRVTELPTAPEDDAEKAAIATAQREQSALSQIQQVSWSVEATKFLNGGTLLTSPVAKSFNLHQDLRILDLGGIATCDWAWQVALDHPTSHVYTVCLPDYPFDTQIATPQNHHQTVVDSLWKLPFKTGYFDCVSARNLHALLKLVRPQGRNGADEYDLVLKECMRVLRPGGYLEFALLDADIMSAGPIGQAMNGRVAADLNALSYDAAPTKTWLTRVRKAGFGQIRRAWLVLPMSQYNSSPDSTTGDASHISGMVGAWAWERWLLKLEREGGGKERSLMGDVAGVLEEGSRTGAGWRYLSGWARKP